MTVFLKKFLHTNWSLILAGGVPCLILFLIYLAQGVFPFEDSSLLTVDLGQQYVDFYTYYRNTLLGDPTSFFYSFSKAIGGDMLGLWAYYLTSPFNLILLLFPARLITLGITVLTLTKISLAGLSFGILLKKAFNGKGFYLATFSTSYALMGYTIVNQLNIMWLDGLIFLPLVILGIEKLVFEKRGLFYTVFLALLLIANYYIAYMICLFSILYFIFRLTAIQFPSKTTVKEKVIFLSKQLARFSWHSLLGGGLASILLVPTFHALLDSKASYSDFSFEWKFAFPIQEMISKLYIGAFNFDQMPDGYPNLFIGSLALICFISFLFSRAFPIRERLMAFLIVLFLVVSMDLKAFNIVWHGFQYPIWYPYRFSFVLCFFMILNGYRAFIKLERLSIPGMLLVVVSTTAAAFYMLKHPFDFVYHEQIILTSLFIAIVTFLLIVKPKYTLWLPFLLFLVSAVEMGINAQLDLSRLSYVSNSEFLEYRREFAPVIDHIKEKDDGFYRVEKTFLRSKNDSFQFDYPSVTHFSSTFEKEVPTLFGHLGFPVGNGFIAYSNATLATDALFGIKYYVAENNGLYEKSQDDLVDPATGQTPLAKNKLTELTQKNNPTNLTQLQLTIMATKPDLRSYTKLTNTDRMTTFKNQNALSIAYGVDKDILKVKELTNQPVQLQETILKALSPNEKKRYFTPIAFNSTVYQNITPNNQYPNPTFFKQIANNKASVDFQFTPQTNDAYYLTLGPSVKEEDAAFYLNGKKLSQYKTYRDTLILNVANQQKGQTITITVELKKESLWLEQFQLYHFDTTAFEKVVTNLKQNELNIEKFGNTYFKGTATITDENKILMTTIPYSKGWRISIDGKKVPTTKVLNSLLAAPIAKGTHNIEISYQTPYFKIGLFISFISLILLVLTNWLFHRGKRHKHF
ncbi:hypothetical protein CKN80_12055 [Carnobacterium divergens]|uniref:YfhO family protein n=1 Tax=Carnobacterium divergens TaxID=2748 RepID=UPI001072702C|nr:YfhO family protein [Carnobacterium divergens]TFJ43277.1 hypothetical protein CKN79_12050 [Carnobacterium divergens]TFJ50430.1 hypothetical protein CKN80_12055 [Carnobacterium divergens]